LDNGLLLRLFRENSKTCNAKTDKITSSFHFHDYDKFNYSVKLYRVAWRMLLGHISCGIRGSEVAPANVLHQTQMAGSVYVNM